MTETGKVNIREEIRRLSTRLNRVFSGLFEDDFSERGGFKEMENYRRAFANLKSTDSEFLIEVELPGVDKKDISLAATDKAIEIRAEKRSEDKVNNDKGYFGSYTGFYRAIRLPEDGDSENTEANYENGILTIKIPRKIKIKRKKEIRIK